MDYRSSQPSPPKPSDPCGCNNQGCTKVGIQNANVSTPIDVTPNVKIGEIETEYLGCPEVSCTESCGGKTGKIVITQNIRMKIPIQYNVITSVGESSIDCCDAPR